MPAGIINNLDTIEKTTFIKKKYTLVAICLILFFILYSERIFNITSPNYIIYVTSIILCLFFAIIFSTFIDSVGYNGNYYLDNFNQLFNSPPSRNFLAVISLVFFIIFVYETPEYGNNTQHHIIDLVTFHNNRYISNRTVGIISILIFSLMTCYTIYITTKDKL